jgi:Protein of unknown function (DUF3102)
MFDTVDSNHLPAIVHVANGGCGHEKPFDYASLMPEQVQAVRACGVRIRTETRRIAESIITIGRELIAVKKTLRHGAFAAWVKSECGFSVRSAQNYMRVARLADKNATVAHLPLATSYRLWGRRTTRRMLTAVAELAADGKESTEAEVERLYKMFRDSKARRTRRLAQNADIRKSKDNPCSELAAKNSKFEWSRGNAGTRAEYVEKSAIWILQKLGPHSTRVLFFIDRTGTLSDSVQLAEEMLRESEQAQDIDEFEDVN